MSPPPTYIEGFPQDGSSLGNTRVQIRNNLDGTFETLGVDHINNNGVGQITTTGTAGFHDVIHFQDQGALGYKPPNVANTTELFTETDSQSIQQVMTLSTGNKLYQQTTMLDGNFTTFGSTIGWVYLPGGFVLLYGFTNPSTSNSIIVDFGGALALPTMINTNYIVTATPYNATPNGYRIGTVTTTTFEIRQSGTTPPNSGYYWVLIGFPA